MITVAEITALKELFFNNAQETFVLLDKNMNIIDVNDAFLKGLHLSREHVIGKNATEMSPGFAKSKRYEIYQEVLQTGKPIMLDEQRSHPSHGNFVTRINVFKAGDGLGIAAMDITDLKEAVDELQTIIYKSSHDLRAPIASILGLMNVAESDLNDLETTQGYLAAARKQAEQLDLILLRLVDAMKIREGNKIIHLINFNQVIQETLTSLKSVEGHDQINITYHINVSQMFYSDRSLILAIFQNIMDNAVKYRKEGIPEALLNIQIEDAGEGVKIIFSDNGIGIPEQLQEDIFKMFFRGTNQSSGSGLGLYIIKECVKKLNGLITVISQEKMGSTFTVRLPNEHP